MKIKKVNHWSDVPENFTGAAEFTNGDNRWYKNGEYHREDGPAIEFEGGEKRWCKEGKLHREDGPAIEWANGRKEWYLNNSYYKQINLNNFVVLDHYKGEYGIMWYKLLDKAEMLEYPDLPGLIIK